MFSYIHDPVQLVERHIIKHNKELEALCFKSKCLYNQSLYYLRQSLFGNIERFSEYELSKLFVEFNEENYRNLPSQTSQQIIKQLFKNWKAYFRSIKEYNQNSSKFFGRPKLPKYKKEQFCVYFTSQQLRIKGGYVCFPKNIKLSPIKTGINTKENKIKQLRIIPQPTCHIIEIVYEKEITDLNLSKRNILSIDLGLKNFITATNNVGKQPFIINGNQIKSYNQWYNKKKSFLQSKLLKNIYSSKRINDLTFYRNNWIEDKMHKISRYVINYCIENDIGTIVIGKNKGWKNKIAIGKKNNQHFVLIPFSKMIDRIKYKSELIGIKVIEIEESYTSKCDALSFEPIEKHEKYKGRREKRGLFQSGVGKRINADINGSLNIMRKVFDDSIVSAIVNSRVGLTPYRINIL